MTDKIIPDVGFANAGLFTNRPECVAGHHKWAETKWDEDPERGMKRIYHPEVRLRWAELMMEQADAELEIVHARRYPWKP